MTRKGYNELGKMLYDLAQARDVTGPYRVAAFIREKTGQGPNGSAWSQIFRGETKQPQRENIMLFIRAFEITGEERQALMNAYLFPGLDWAA